MNAVPVAQRRTVWDRFYRGREERWCRHDGLAAAVAILVLCIAGLRVEQQVDTREVLLHTALVGLALLLMASQRMEGYTAWRNVAVVTLRLGLCSSSIIQKHAFRILSGLPASSRGLWAVPAATLSMLIGDHTALLAFLGWAWPVGTLSNTLVQLACLCLITNRNAAMCATPYIRQATASIMREPVAGISAAELLSAERHTWLPFFKWTVQADQEQICRWYTLGIQVTLGFLAPCLQWMCSDVRAALQYADQERIDPRDRLYRMYRFLSRWLCSWQASMYWLLAVVSAGLALAAAGGLVLR